MDEVVMKLRAIWNPDMCAMTNRDVRCEMRRPGDLLVDRPRGRRRGRIRTVYERRGVDDRRTMALSRPDERVEVVYDSVVARRIAIPDRDRIAVRSNIGRTAVAGYMDRAWV